MVNMRLSKPLESGYSRYGILMYPFQAGCVLYAKRRSIVLPGDLGDEFHHDWWVDTSQVWVVVPEVLKVSVLGPLDFGFVDISIKTFA